jgi:hypothetical protein
VHTTGLEHTHTGPLPSSTIQIIFDNILIYWPDISSASCNNTCAEICVEILHYYYLTNAKPHASWLAMASMLPLIGTHQKQLSLQVCSNLTKHLFYSSFSPQQYMWRYLSSLYQFSVGVEKRARLPSSARLNSLNS